MRYVKYLFLAVIAILIVVVAAANRQLVVLTLLPAVLADFLGVQQQVGLPLYAVIIGSISVGLLIGFVWEWLREWRYRRAASVRRREVNRLARENDRLRAEKHEGEDEVLAMLERPAR